MIEAIDGLVCEGEIANACRAIPTRKEAEMPQIEWQKASPVVCQFF